MSLHARYVIKSKYVSGGVTVEEIRDRDYVRTPDAILMKEKCAYTPDPNAKGKPVIPNKSAVTISFNRKTNEYRSLREFANGWPPSGEISKFPPDETGDLTSVESVAQYWAGASLYWMVKSGKILEERQTVAGHSCIGVSYDVVPNVQRHVIWVDPDIGYCARRMELVIRGQVRMRRTMSDYKQIRDGIWFPGKITLELFDKTGAPREEPTISIVNSAAMTPTDPKVKLEVVFPANAGVSDKRGKPLLGK